MKSLIIATAFLASGLAHAAEITGGRYNLQTKSIDLDVRYGGGCADHDFSLAVGACQESFPVSCAVKLIEKTTDTCEALIYETISISLKSAKLNDSYYDNAQLRISGDNNSSVSIRLPNSVGNSNEEEMFDGGAELLSGKYNARTRSLEFTVKHGGGCGDHKYSLALKGCAESFPVQCQADLVHKTNDTCEALISRKFSISLDEAGLNESYYSGGSLTVKGANNSEVTVRLPEIN
jgi:hypothetical protein